ncbi:GNAT family N-acetyltransferase [Nocardioides flavescens]|uniref:PE-PGRS family protein n=1 Tax=Nocardioides flavescens TaxID=2691959 RepID=A0A6L7F1T1_9ACTN|nr:GNAT family N-acetyltransferase [Nocardioides flavescens]MXG90522.1 PE-PGRS family protein [Nocardioides flavescens]
MTGPEVVRVHPRDDLFDAWHATYAEAVGHRDGPWAAAWQREEMRVSVADSVGAVTEVYAATAGGRVLATGWLRASTVDNPTTAEVEVTTAVAERGRGHAALVLARLEERARELGRTTLTAELAWPDDDPDGARSPDLRWARRHGFEVGLVDVQRRLALPVADAALDALAREAAEHHRGYELRSFTGPVPDDLAQGWADLAATLMTEAPTGDIAREIESADVGVLREREATIERQGRIKVSTAALTAGGEVVAYTDLAVTRHEPDRAYQWGTLVRADHRGHRLGLALKVANLRLLQQAHPQVRTLLTYNAEVNAPMVAVNERLGFRPVLRLGELHKKVETQRDPATRE